MHAANSEKFKTDKKFHKILLLSQINHNLKMLSKLKTIASKFNQKNEPIKSSSSCVIFQENNKEISPIIVNEPIQSSSSCVIFQENNKEISPIIVNEPIQSSSSCVIFQENNEKISPTIVKNEPIHSSSSYVPPKKKTGRPMGSKNLTKIEKNPPTIVKKEPIQSSSSYIPSKKKPGRPMGSKNLTKIEKKKMERFNRELRNESSRNSRIRQKNKIDMLELENITLKKENEKLKSLINKFK